MLTKIMPALIRDRKGETTMAQLEKEQRSKCFDVANRVLPSLHKHPERLLRSLASTLESYPPELVDEISSVMDERPVIMFKIRSLLKERRAASRVRECLMFLRLDLAHPMSIEKHIAGLRYYEQLPESRDYSQEDERTREIVTAIVSFTAMLDATLEHFDNPPLVSVGMDEVFPMIRDERIVDLIIAHPEKATAMAELIIERRNGDYELVRQMVESESLPLTTGLL